MAQIIKHRRGSIDSLKGSLARKGELVIATGSIGNMNGPWVFVGDSDANGAYKPTSQIYRGNTAPTISNLTYGSTLDGTPFYSITSKSLFILDSTGNAELDLTGNIEGNTISGVTINDLQSTNVTASFISGAFFGDAGGLYNIPASGVTNLDLSRIVSGSATASISPDLGLQVNVDISTTNDLFVTGTIHVGDNTASQIYYDGMLYVEDTTNGVQIKGGNSSYLTANSNGYVGVYSYQGGTDVTADGGGNLWLWAEGGGNTNVASYDGGVVNINTDGTTGDVYALNGTGNKLYIHGDVELTGSLFATKIEGTGSLYLQPDQADSRLFEIYNTTGVTGNDIHIKGNADYSYFGGDVNYLKVDDLTGNITLIGDNGVNISSNVGNVAISSFDGSQLGLNNDGGEGNVNIGNYSNSIYGYTNTTDLWANNYAQLGSSGSFVWVENLGAHLHNDSGSAGVGFTARPNGIIEATGSFNINGDTSITGALVVSDGSATFDQGLVAQNSNMLLTSGSALIVQDSGYVATDYIRGNAQEWNYLALNSNGLFSPSGVELASSGNISLWAEGGQVSITGSLNVTGDIIFSGSINLGDYTGDTINFNGEVSSSILPQTGSSFDLGASGQTWNNVWAENAHFTNISIGDITLTDLSLPGDLSVSGATTLSGSVSVSSLTEGRVVTVGTNGSLVDSNGFNWSTGSNQLGISGSIKLDDNGYIYHDGPLFFEDTTNGIQLNGGNGSYLEINSNGYSKLHSNDNGLDIEASGNGAIWLWSNYSNVNISSYDGSQLNLNNDGGEGNVNIGNGNNNLNINSNTYIDTDKTLYVNNIWDNSDNSNYLQLYGWNTDDGYWWEGGNGHDTTLLNNINNANLNILQTNNGDVNIDATGGSVNLHSANGFNVTGSMVVSDASGVFNSSLIAYNSDLTLDGSSNLNMNDGAHLYFNNGCGDIYYNSGDDELTLYNDCGDIRFRNVTRTNYNMYFEDGNTLYTNNIYGYDGGNLDIAANDNIYIYSENTHYVEIYANNSEDGTNRLKVQESGISIETYDFASGLTHKVLLDNTGSLKLTNVALQLSGSLNVDGNSIFNNNLTVGGDMYVSGNFQVLGTGSIITLTGSQIDIGTNLINLNTYAPFERFAGINVFDSGSNVGVTGSLLWDSQNDVWIYANPSGSSYASARFIAGPKNTGSLGEEEGLTVGHFPIATGDDHISDSLLTYEGTTLALNTNKFTVDSDNGNTLIHGNFTIEGTGAEDKGDYGSYIVFRNEDNILGFVGTSDTENVTDRLLGYNASSGVLEFSSLIDGGTY
jgi:hypothetical protein